MQWFATVKQRDERETYHKDIPVFWFQVCQQLLYRFLNACVYVCVCVCVCFNKTKSLLVPFILLFLLPYSFLFSFLPSFCFSHSFLSPSLLLFFCPLQTNTERIPWALCQLPGHQTTGNQFYSWFGLAWRQLIYQYLSVFNTEEEQLLTALPSSIHPFQHKSKTLSYGSLRLCGYSMFLGMHNYLSPHFLNVMSSQLSMEFGKSAWQDSLRVLQSWGSKHIHVNLRIIIYGNSKSSNSLKHIHFQKNVPHFSKDFDV